MKLNLSIVTPREQPFRFGSCAALLHAVVAAVIFCSFHNTWATTTFPVYIQIHYAIFSMPRKNAMMGEHQE